MSSNNDSMSVSNNDALSIVDVNEQKRILESITAATLASKQDDELKKHDESVVGGNAAASKKKKKRDGDQHDDDDDEYKGEDDDSSKRRKKASVPDAVAGAGHQQPSSVPKELIVDHYDSKKPVCIAIATSAIIRHLTNNAWKPEYEQAYAVLAHLMPRLQGNIHDRHVLTHVSVLRRSRHTFSLLVRQRRPSRAARVCDAVRE